MNRRARRLVATTQLLDEQCRARAAIQVLETSSLAELDEAVRSIAATDRSTPVVLAGGDGSYMAGVSALSRELGGDALPPIAFLPGGTVGTIARNWGVRGDPVSYSRRLLDALSEGKALKTVRRPTLRVGDRVGFICGAGLVARFFEKYVEGGSNGTRAAAGIVARVFGGSFFASKYAREVLDPSPCGITVDGEPASFDRISLLCASVVRDLGLGMKLLYRAGEELDRFHIVATPLGARLLGPQMPLVLAGRPLLGPKVDTLARRVRLANVGAYVLDGDLFFARDVLDISAGPPIDLIQLDD